MRRTWIALLGAALLLTAGCSSQSNNPSGSATAGQETQAAASFDDFLQATKLEMITKAASDLPKNWKFQGQEAQEKAALLVPVLKSATKLDIKEPVKSPPMVTFIGDTPAGKRIVNVFQDRFEFSGVWYQLDDAPDKTYGPVKP